MTIAANHGKDGRFTPGNSSGVKFQPKNAMALRTGLRCRLTLPDLPAAMKNVKRAINSFRGALERACIEAHDGISITQAAFISSACQAEQFARLWARRLSKDYETMSEASVGAATDRIVKYTAQRDAAIQRLRLDDDAVDSLRDFYTLPGVVGEAPAVEPPVSVDRGQAPAGVNNTEPTT